MQILRTERFGEGLRAEEIVSLIKELNIDREIRILNVCGSHEHTICRWGLRSLLPKNIRLIPGPGCPVCVTSQEDIYNAILLSCRDDTIVATYGDMIRVPTRAGSLKSAGKNVKIITSCHQVFDLCREFPDKKVVFFSIGFETTAAPAASLFFMNPPANFCFLSSHKLTTAAMRSIIDTGLDAFIAPGHVSAVVGYEVWEEFPRIYGIPVVVAGFTPEDVLLAVAVILKQLREGESRVENVYTGVVRREGNVRAKALMERVFEVASVVWRGMGRVPDSGLVLRDEFAKYDVKSWHGWQPFEDEEEAGCICADVIVGRAYPSDCALFGRRCTPHTPVGPCMVSAEGACNIWYRFGGF